MSNHVCVVKWPCDQCNLWLMVYIMALWLNPLLANIDCIPRGPGYTEKGHRVAGSTTYGNMNCIENGGLDSDGFWANYSIIPMTLKGVNGSIIYLYGINSYFALFNTRYIWPQTWFAMLWRNCCRNWPRFGDKCRGLPHHDALLGPFCHDRLGQNN